MVLSNSVRRNFVFLLAILMAASALVFAGSAQPVRGVNGGPVVLMGIDAEDGGVGGHGPISTYVNVVNSILANVGNGGSGILVFGCGKNAGDNVTTFWNAIQTGTGVSVTCVNGAANITSQSLAGFAMVGVVSDQYNTGGGGLTDAENGALTPRASNIANFVNGGGGLLGFSSDFCAYGTTACYGYLGNIGAFSFNVGLGISDVTGTAAGQALGIDNPAGNFDFCCWHDEYVTFPAFLNVLATSAQGGTGAPVAIGGAQVILQPENCSNGIDDDGDGLIDLQDPDCQQPPPPPGQDTTPPTVACIETVNPNGRTVPPAGSTTLPGTKGGQNEDGFYQLKAQDDTDPNPQIFVVDTGSGTVFGPFASGTNIKYTEAPGATPSQKTIGSTQGQAGAVQGHITGTSDMGVLAVDASGNKSAIVTCLVPPLPK